METGGFLRQLTSQPASPTAEFQLYERLEEWHLRLSVLWFPYMHTLLHLHPHQDNYRPIQGDESAKSMGNRFKGQFYSDVRATNIKKGNINMAESGNPQAQPTESQNQGHDTHNESGVS